ncbi:MAG: Ig-like domain-containing protein [Bacteroidetes bacterium]|nr:Ig-like domain-containing protein [Bacteroidota bacterium]
MKKYFLFVLCSLPLACAVPVPPTGGPPDQKPPTVLETIPANGMTHFTGRDIEFVFDEPVDLRSFTSAFSISPDVSGTPIISGSGRRIRVRLPEDPRPETTYIISLETTLRDVHNVVLERPITLAFSTGAVIDAAKMSGLVVKYLDGTPLSAIDVFAYAADDSTSLSLPPLYRTQTGKSGEFRFEHVAARDYFVVAVSDRNRNRKRDVGEAIGISPVHYLTADTLGTAPTQPWIMANFDTEPLVLERVRAVSTQDLELRFSKPLDVNVNVSTPFSTVNGTNLAVYDSLDVKVSDLEVYFKETKSRVLFARSSVLTPGSYRVKGTVAVADSSQNAASQIASSFVVASNTPAAIGPAFSRWMPDSSVVTTALPRTIWPTEVFGFRTDRPVADARYSATLRDTSGTTLTVHFSKEDATFFVFDKTTDFSFNQPFFLDINQKDFGGLDSLVTGFFQFATDRQLGSLSFVAKTEPDRSSRNLIVEGFDASNKSVLLFKNVISGGNHVVIDKLPGGKRLFLRVIWSSKTRWFPGQLSPWLPADPLTWIDVKEPIRARWETALPDTVSFDQRPRPSERK